MIEKKKGVDGKTYKVINDTWYSKDTSDEVVNLLENLRNSGRRIRVYYGDIISGKDWGEIHDVTGTIGRSTGQIKIPLLIYNKRSMGGGGLLDSAIVKIETSKGKRGIYEHPNFHTEPPTEEILNPLKSKKGQFAFTMTPFVTKGRGWWGESGRHRKARYKGLRLENALDKIFVKRK